MQAEGLRRSKGIRFRSQVPQTRIGNSLSHKFAGLGEKKQSSSLQYRELPGLTKGVVRACKMTTKGPQEVNAMGDGNSASLLAGIRESYFRKTIDAIPTMVWTALPDGSRDFVNRPLLNYTGLALEQMLGTKWQQVVHPEDLPHHVQKWNSYTTSGKPFEDRLRVRSADGTYRWFLDRAVPSRNEHGELTGWYCVSTDINEYKRAEEEVQQQEHMLQMIMDIVPQHMFILRMDAMHSSFRNRAAAEYFDLSAFAEFRSPLEMYENYVHPEDIEDLKDRLLIAQRTHDGIEAEARMRGRDGKYRWFLHHLFPFVDGEGKILYWCGTRIDIDDRKRAGDIAQRENLVLREEVDKVSMFEEIVGTSLKLQPVLARVSKVAPTDSTVLITGETGTGKELIARAIHKRSRRANHAFVSVNCAALPKDLVPSELFGHEKGAFTGALQRRLGRFELADEGTIFLDEIGELPAETQVALLRVLQEREFERVGGNQTIRTNARVIAATHQDLPAAIEGGTFRSDLYYRINIFPIEIPSLRERSDDIRLLVEYFVERFSSKAGKKIRRIDGKSLAQLQAYSWPGNIRELQNIIERSVILCENDVFSIDESWLSNRLETKRSLPTEVINREREMIEEALAQTKGRVSGPSGAAAKLGMPPSTLDSKIKSLGIDKRSFHRP
jgi:formate hydrogenlyase transcriptional activator